MWRKSIFDETLLVLCSRTIIKEINSHVPLPLLYVEHWGSLFPLYSFFLLMRLNMKEIKKVYNKGTTFSTS